MSRLLSDIIDTLLPPKCIFCRKTLRRGERDYCAECERSLPYRGRGREPGPDFVEAVCAPFDYDGKVRTALMNYKFLGARGCAEAVGRFVAGCVRENLAGEYDLISWVPLSGARLRERGYDQAMLLAMAAALELGDVAVETLRKIRDAEPQSGKRGLAERRANISGAYECADPELVRDKRILLIDDIVTTGATVSECARTLGLAGAESVVCAFAARA